MVANPMAPGYTGAHRGVPAEPAAKGPSFPAAKGFPKGAIKGQPPAKGSLTAAPLRAAVPGRPILVAESREFPAILIGAIMGKRAARFKLVEQKYNCSIRTLDDAQNPQAATKTITVSAATKELATQALDAISLAAEHVEVSQQALDFLMAHKAQRLNRLAELSDLANWTKDKTGFTLMGTPEQIRFAKLLLRDALLYMNVFETLDQEYAEITSKVAALQGTSGEYRRHPVGKSITTVVVDGAIVKKRPPPAPEVEHIGIPNPDDDYVPPVGASTAAVDLGPKRLEVTLDEDVFQPKIGGLAKRSTQDAPQVGEVPERIAGTTDAAPRKGRGKARGHGKAEREPAPATNEAEFDPAARIGKRTAKGGGRAGDQAPPSQGAKETAPSHKAGSGAEANRSKGNGKGDKSKKSEEQGAPTGKGRRRAEPPAENTKGRRKGAARE